MQSSAHNLAQQSSSLSSLNPTNNETRCSPESLLCALTTLRRCFLFDARFSCRLSALHRRGSFKKPASFPGQLASVPVSFQRSPQSPHNRQFLNFGAWTIYADFRLSDYYYSGCADCDGQVKKRKRRPYTKTLPCHMEYLPEDDILC